ncbi:hypothetical protein [Pontiella sulfatireligans]|uniref:Uncharacterized protein n=1 Tax=Pontiella sulfatireligans TaxID=2750658 RepID=A0A6C2UDR3_9BACT|nr:hypothetical protein [Pontiella sulfatireligans]VGO17983.1 hypothetical protein SCARR_00033 [Pontiella sulfatireligans]
MAWRTVKRVLNRLDAVARGYCECKGVFWITDQAGNPLSNVLISYRVGDSDWVSCGNSQSGAECRENYIQSSSIFYQMGEAVFWRFSMPGYADKIITRYTADMDFNKDLDTIVLRKKGGEAPIAAYPIEREVGDAVEV